MLNWLNLSSKARGAKTPHAPMNQPIKKQRNGFGKLRLMLPELCVHCGSIIEYHSPKRKKCPSGPGVFTPGIGLGRIDIISSGKRVFVHLPDMEREANGCDFLVLWNAYEALLAKYLLLSGASLDAGPCPEKEGK